LNALVADHNSLRQGLFNILERVFLGEGPKWRGVGHWALFLLAINGVTRGAILAGNNMSARGIAFVVGARGAACHKCETNQGNKAGCKSPHDITSAPQPLNSRKSRFEGVPISL
jgi:hypothetical protein